MTVSDVLPSGLTVTQAVIEPEEGACPMIAAGEVVCTMPVVIRPAGFVVVDIEFTVTGAIAGALRDVASVSGGGADKQASGEAVTRVGSGSGPAGVARFAFEATGSAGGPSAQAAAHPTFLTTSLVLNSMNVENLVEGYRPVEAPKDLVFYLPLGMLGNPAVTDPCPASIVETTPGKTGCPPSSRVGTVLPSVLSTSAADDPDPTHEHGIYNVAPEKGYAAEFAFTSNNYTFFLYASVVRHNGAYMLRVAIPGVPQIAYLEGSMVTSMVTSKNIS